MNDISEKPTFEKALADLDRIVKQLEEGQVGLEESLALYEQGIGLVRRCQGQLGKAEQRILELLGQDETGKAVTAPFRHSASV